MYTTPARPSRELQRRDTRAWFLESRREMTRKVAGRRWTASGSSLTRMAAFLLLVAIAVLADTIKVAECRSVKQYDQVSNDYINDDYLADSVATDDDEEDQEGEAAVGGSVTPSILTTGLVVETAEGTTVNLPCKVAAGSLDEVALIWINGTKSIMTDTFLTSTDPRIRQGPKSDTPTPGYDEHTLLIDQVTRWDSGSYTCRITSRPPVDITHTLRVTHPAKILMVQANGVDGSSNAGGAKKFTVKQGEPVQMVCSVAGYPEPTVQWTKRAKYQQQQITTQSPGQDQNPVPSPQPQLPSTSVVVSNTNEVRIESVAAYRDAGSYECVAYNSVSAGSAASPGAGGVNPARSSLELEVEYQPDVAVPRRVINTEDMYAAQLVCSVHAFPKPKVTWEKALTTASGSLSWQLLTTDGSNSRYVVTRQSNANGVTGPSYILKVKEVQSSEDFGQYRCVAENKHGISYSDSITLTGSPARPQQSYVQIKPSSGTAAKSGSPELGWDVDSLSPLVEYQLQYKRQQDSPDSWTDVRPQPQVVDTSSGGNAGDERRYSMSYVFGGEAHQIDGQHTVGGSAAVVPLSLEHGTTYVARLRARNVHGWSEWSTDVVFSGGMDDDTEGNEINQNGGHQHDHEKVLKAATDSSGALPAGPKQSRGAAIVLAAILALAVTAVSVC